MPLKPQIECRPILGSFIIVAATVYVGGLARCRFFLVARAILAINRRQATLGGTYRPQGGARRGYGRRTTMESLQEFEAKRDW
jgi:hypothetical protein